MNQQIRNCINQIMDAKLLFVKDEWNEANHALSKVLQSVNEIVQELLRQQRNEEQIQKIMVVLEVLNQAMESEDAIQIADLIGYDLREILLEIPSE